MIRLNDGKPWFRRWMRIGFKAIAPEGLLVQFLMAAGFLLFGSLAVVAREGSTAEVLSSGACLLTVIGGYAVVFKKMEDEF